MADESDNFDPVIAWTSFMIGVRTATQVYKAQRNDASEDEILEVLERVAKGEETTVDSPGEHESVLSKRLKHEATKIMLRNERQAARLISLCRPKS